MASIIELGRGREIATQTVNVGGSSISATNPLGSKTQQIRIAANTACHVKIGDGSISATTSDPFLPANWVEYVMVTPGQTVATIQASTNGLVTATAGTLWVTELG